MERLLNVAVPLTAAPVNVPLSVPPLGLVPMATVTLAVLLVRLPLASTIWTVTAGEIVAPPFVLLGCTPKVSLLAAPTVSVSTWVAEVAAAPNEDPDGAGELAEAVSVGVPTPGS